MTVRERHSSGYPSRDESTPAAQSHYRNYMPLLAYIGGKQAAFTSAAKPLIVIDNSRKTVECNCEWSLHNFRGHS